MPLPSGRRPLLNAIHVTHEAVHKVGGIGTVLEGLINSRPYRQRVARTLFVCPIFDPDGRERMGPGGQVEYSSLDHRWEGPLAPAFARIEAEFGVHIAYGRRPVTDSISGRSAECEVLLIDVRHVRPGPVNALKGLLWERYGLQSHVHEHVWDFEQYVRLAAPACAALDALELASEAQPAVAFAHEFMGVPTVLALAARRPEAYRALFHAHEVATVRRLVEHHPGHDLMFYNALEAARRHGLYLADVFGPQHDYFKHALIETTRNFDEILAVGHHVVEELRFLGAAFVQTDIALAYNGIPSERITPADRAASRGLLLEYCQALLGWRPEWVFTHVTRLAPSKALWRDLDVLEALDAQLVDRGQRAVFLVLSTELPRRAAADVLRMEAEWDWPLVHREQPPDLTEGEADYYRRIQAFNVRARNVRAVYLNQFGFQNPACGRRMPEAMRFADIRRGTDLEFGLSLYEPFGISPLEPLTFGGLCVVSTSCGCAGFVRDATGGKPPRNVILGDYIHAVRAPATVGEAIAIGREQRRAAERQVAAGLARRIAERLPADDRQRERLMASGFELAARMSWDVVAERYVMPAVERALARRRILHVA